MRLLMMKGICDVCMYTACGHVKGAIAIHRHSLHEVCIHRTYSSDVTPITASIVAACSNNKLYK